MAEKDYVSIDAEKLLELKAAVDFLKSITVVVDDMPDNFNEMSVRIRAIKDFVSVAENNVICAAMNVFCDRSDKNTVTVGDMTVNLEEAK